jgi:6-phosphogluconolactonase/glucosamine-6-phosphate isomerase/deaminase
VLSGQSIEQTTRAWSGKLSTLLDQSDFVLGLFGIGPDGHTSGILPNSPAVDAGGLVVHYDGGQYLRITTTPSFIAKLDEAVVYAVGKSKWPTLERLSRSVPTSEQPAQVLKRVPKLTVFTDYDEHAKGK